MLQTPSVQPAGDIPAPVEWLPDSTVRLVDQTLLPIQLEYLHCRSVESLAGAIRALKVRGAPVIGIAAAYGLCLAASLSPAQNPTSLLADLEAAASLLRRTRPTAVNLPWALQSVLQAARQVDSSVDAIKSAVYLQARRIDRDNTEATRRMGANGSPLLRDGMNVLTHCNTGPLAAGGIGSALGVIYTAHRQGKLIHVWVDETRPLLQGARLTTWELARWGIPCTLITDNMAASLMRARKVDAVLVGADRIAANGDLANKIGTYGLAVLARAHDIPFYSVAPISTFDPSLPSGDGIKIEERHPDEVTHHAGTRSAPYGVGAYNPAFDVTPAGAVSAIVTEAGVLRPPYEQTIADAFRAGHSYAHSPSPQTREATIRT